MAYSFTEKKRIRKDFGKQQSVLDVPDLLSIQLASYNKFLQRNVDPAKRKNLGLEAAFNTLFPIESFSKNARLEFVSYRLDDPEFNVRECQLRGLSYASPIRVKTKLITYNKETNKETLKEVKNIKESGDTTDVYFGEIPLMTEHGTFVINGTDRVVVSQLHRSPGVFFDHDKGVQSSGKLLFSARIIPYRGSWLDFEFDAKDAIFARIDRRRKISVTIMLHALGLSNEEILDIFFEKDKFSLSKKEIKLHFKPDHFKGITADFDIKIGRKVIIKKGQRINGGHLRRLEELSKKNKFLTVPVDHLEGKVIAHDVVEPTTGELLALTNEILSIEKINILIENGVKAIETIHISGLDHGDYISNSMRIDPSSSKQEALT